MTLNEVNKYRAAIERGAQATAADSSADEMIETSGLYPSWMPGDHYVGEIYNAHGQTWECYAAYDNSIYPDVTPAGAAWQTFNKPLHGTTPETARPWVQPIGAQDMYLFGECMIWTDGGTYRCCAENGTVYAPDMWPDGWEVV